MYVMLEWTLLERERGSRNFFFAWACKEDVGRRGSGPTLSGPMRGLGFNQKVDKKVGDTQIFMKTSRTRGWESTTGSMDEKQQILGLVSFFFGLFPPGSSLLQHWNMRWILVAMGKVSFFLVPGAIYKSERLLYKQTSETKQKEIERQMSFMFL